MIRETCISVESETEWKEALSGIPHGFAHTWENCYAMTLTTSLNTFLYCFEEEAARIVCPLAERRFGDYTDIVTPFGFSGFVGIGHPTAIEPRWADFVTRKGYVCGYIGLNPILFDDRLFTWESQAYHSVYTLDLTEPADLLFARLDRNRRRQLSSTEQFVNDVVTDQETLRAFFLEHYAEFYAGRGATSTYQFSRATIEFLLRQHNVTLIGAPRGGLQSVLVLVHTPTMAESLFSVSLAEGKRYSAPLLWYGVQQLRSMGIATLNLGGGVRERDGVAQFKERFGATRRPLRCLKQVYRTDIFRDLCRQVGTNPDDRDGYFPPYRKTESRAYDAR